MMTGQQLKNSILQMAVQGKLVPQDLNDEPASVLLERIRKEKEQLIKEGKIKKEKNPSYIFRGADSLPYEKVGNNEPVCIADEVPFEIPESWEWVRLSSLVSKEIRRGKSPKYSVSSGIQVFAQKCNVKNGGIDMTLAKYLDPTALKKYPVEEYLQDQDIIVNSTGNGTLGRIGVFRDANRIDESVIVPDSHVTVIRLLPSTNKNYLLNVLRYYQPYLEKLGEGFTNQTELKPAVIANLFVPLPPQEEQIRIVDKLVKVFPLVEKYGNHENALVDLNSKFPDQLKKSILQEAVQGKLVPQDPNDEPASVLLERIHAEKERLIKEGKIKRDKHESVIFKRDNSHYEKLDGIERCIDDEIPFEIPESWGWTSIGEVCTNIQYGSSQKSSPTGKVAVLRMGNLQKGRIILDKLAYTSDTKEIEKYPLEYNDLLFNRTNSKELVGKVAIYKSEIPAIYAGYLVRLHPILIDSDYLNYIMQSQYYWIYCQNVRSDAIGQSNINAEKLKHFIFPLPPIQEQKRVVNHISYVINKIEQL